MGESKTPQQRSRIPRVIVQTGARSEDEPRRNKWRDSNPGYKYEYFDNKRCTVFLAEHFGLRAVMAFQGLRPGAFKADLFRYAYLYVHGGVYIDLDCMPVFGTKLDHILEPETDMVSVAGRGNIQGIFQAFLACKPGVEELKIAVEQICLHVEQKWYPAPPLEGSSIWPAVWSITGPVLLSNVMGGIYQPGFYDVDGTSVYLYPLGSTQAAPVVSEDGRVMMLGTTSEYVQNKREPYENFVLARKVYTSCDDSSSVTK